MKKIIVFMIVFLAFSFNASAQVEIGLHGAYTFGGDIEKSDIGYGGQVLIRATENIAFEISVTKFSDGVETVTMDVIHAAGTVLFYIPMNENTRLYGGVGVSRNSFDAKIAVPNFYATVDDNIGFHAALGMETNLSDRVKLFGEVRHTWSSTTAEIKGPCGCEDDVTANFDFLFVGFGLRFSL